MADENAHWIYVAEVDADAVAAAIRRRQIFFLALIPVFLAIMGVAAVMRVLNGPPPSLSVLVWGSLVAVIIPAAIAYLAVPRWMKEVGVDVGGDFLVGPRVDSPRHRAVVKYEDIRAVGIRVSKGRILGATIWPIRTGRIRNPGIVVRAIFERAPEDIKWCRSPWFRKMSREEVRRVIEEAQVPDIDALLPPSKHYVLADEVFSKDRPEEPLPSKRGWLAHLLGGGTCRSVDLVSPQIPTPVSRYVNLMFLQMFESRRATRTLNRWEPLPVVTFKTETAKPPSLEDVLRQIWGMCTPPPKRHRGPVDGTINVTIQETPCRILCRFDDSSDACCEIRLERVAE